MDPGNATHDLDFFLNGVVQTTADLRDHNLRLKSENERLEGQLSEMTPELKQLRKERVTLKAAIGALLRQNGALPVYVGNQRQRPATFETFPHEILQNIFNLATSTEPTHQFDPSIQPGAHNPWLELLRMKKAFPLICRGSLWPGMSVLYSDIVLRRMGQVSALAATLRTPDVGPRLGNLVKGIRWDSCVVAAQCSDVIREDLAFIFAQCTRLRSFSYHPHTSFPLRSQIPHEDECEGFFNPLWSITIPSSFPDRPLLQTASCNLRLLEMDFNMDDAILQAIHRILPTLNALESLALGCWPTYPSSSLLPEDSELMNMPVVSLPCLTTLRIFATSSALDQYLCSRWEIPQLSRLTILFCPGWPGTLLARFGCRLRYLHLFPTLRVFSDPQAYRPTLEACSTLSATCPLLEHLVVPKLKATASYPLLLDSPTLVHLDLWTPTSDRLCGRRQDESSAAKYRRSAVKPESTVPSLRTVRLLLTEVDPSRRGCAACTSHTRNPDWPWVCHPSLLAEGSGDVLYSRFPQGWVAQTVAAIIPQDLGSYWWRGRCWEEGWPAVYGNLEEVLQVVKYGEGASDSEADADGGAEEQDAQDETMPVCSDSTEGGGEDGACSDEDDAVIGNNAEAREKEEQEEREQEEQDMIEAAAELVLPEYPVVQLDRVDVLAAFRRSRDRESYNHTDFWDDC
ncbi:hypothetical protein V8D89_010044 [Ganoderma adspersum]